MAAEPAGHVQAAGESSAITEFCASDGQHASRRMPPIHHLGELLLGSMFTLLSKVISMMTSCRSVGLDILVVQQGGACCLSVGFQLSTKTINRAGHFGTRGKSLGSEETRTLAHRAGLRTSKKVPSDAFLGGRAGGWGGAFAGVGNPFAFSVP